MPRSSRLTLILPNLGRPAVSPPSTIASEKFPLLARLGSRGERSRRWHADDVEQARLEPWQRALLESLQLDEHAHDSAALSALGMQLNAAGKDWWHATPIHLAAGLNDVAFVPLDGDLSLSETELDALTATIAAHLESAMLCLHRAHGSWLIESSEPWQFRCVNVRFASSHDWNTALPQGPDSGRLRRLLTELQMVLHDHSVNERRAARGLPAANALWIWGNGRLHAREMRATASFLVGDHAFVRGVRTSDHIAGCDNASELELVEHAAHHDNIVAVVDCVSLDELEARWLTPIVASLKRGAFESLRLIVDEWQITITRSQLRRFWRRDQPTNKWLFA